MTNTVRAFLLASLLSALFSGEAHAGMPHVPCQSPFVYSGADVNVVVLPYRESGLPNVEGRGSGTRLSLLIEMDVLAHILPHGSVGAVQMEATSLSDESSCRPEFVGNKLLGKFPGGTATIAPGKGLVLVWGLLYQEDEDLYVQTFASFLRRDRAEDLTFSAATDKFIARPSSQMIAFAPRRLSTKDLQRIDEAFQRTNVLHTEPKDNSPGEKLGVEGRGVSGFWVNGRSGQWLQITRMNPDGSSTRGWLHASVGLSGASLDAPMPELNFIEGVVGYLSARINADANVAPDAGSAIATEGQLTEFMKVADSDQEAMAVAVAAQLEGITGLLSRKDLLAGLTFAQPLFERARTLVPYSGDAIALATLSEVSRASLAPRSPTDALMLQDPRITAQRLAQASILDPGNPRALTNLHNFYNVVLRSQQTGAIVNQLDRAEVQKQIKAIELNQFQPVIPKELGATKWIDPAKLPYDPKQMKLDVQDFKRTQMMKDAEAVRR